MKQKITAKNIMTYVLLIGLVGLVAMYFLVYKDYTDKTTTLENSSRQIQAHIEELQGYKDNLEMYESRVADMREHIVEITERFPADIKEEDYLYLALATLNVEEDVTYSAVNVSDRTEISTIPASEIADAGIETLDEDLIFVKRVGSLVSSTTYKGLKECVEVINNSKDRRNISNISFTRNKEENCLDGTIEVTSYILYGTDKEYEPKDFSDYEAGLSDLFSLKTKEEWFMQQLEELFGITDLDDWFGEDVEAVEEE